MEHINEFIAKRQGIRMNKMIENAKSTPKEIKEIVKEIKTILDYKRAWKYRGYMNVNPEENIYTILFTKYNAKRNCVIVNEVYYYSQNPIGKRLRLFAYCDMTDYMNSQEIHSPFIG